MQSRRVERGAKERARLALLGLPGIAVMLHFEPRREYSLLRIMHSN